MDEVFFAAVFINLTSVCLTLSGGYKPDHISLHLVCVQHQKGRINLFQFASVVAHDGTWIEHQGFADFFVPFEAVVVPIANHIVSS